MSRAGSAPLSTSNAQKRNSLRMTTNHIRQKLLEFGPWIASPMVHQSELTFRLLCRRYNVGLASTPMLNAKVFACTPEYRNLEYQTHKDDHPLIAQLAGPEPKDMLASSKYLTSKNCSVIDLNFGCPQAIARRGNYGAFLLHDIPRIKSLVQVLRSNTNVPVSCKIRLLDTKEETLDVAHALVDAGCQMLTVHGRTRHQNKQRSGSSSWQAVRAVASALRKEDVVIVSNGGVASLSEAQDCMQYTGADGVMSAEGLLCNPSLFYDITRDVDPIVQAFVKRVQAAAAAAARHDNEENVKKKHQCCTLFTCLLEMRQLGLAQEYMTLARLHCDNYLKPVRSHLFKLCHVSLSLSENNDVRGTFAQARTFAAMELAVNTLEQRALHGMQRELHDISGRRSLPFESSVVVEEAIEWVSHHEEKRKSEQNENEEYSARYRVAAIAALEHYFGVSGMHADDDYSSANMSNLWYSRHPREECPGGGGRRIEEVCW